MKKSKLVTIVVASALSALCCGSALACGDNNEPGKQIQYVFEYEITVTGGTGGGTVKDGTNCTVTAEVPVGKVFDKWVDDYGNVISTANPYTFKVDGDLNLTAVLTDAQTFNIEVVGGVITGTSDYQATVYAGQSVSVTALSSQSHKFVKWIINDSEESVANPYVFTANKDMRLEARVDESFLVAVSGGTIGDTDEVRKIYKDGEECTIKAAPSPEGSEFVYWYVLDEDEKEVRVAYSETYTFAVKGTDKYYAKYGKKYTLNVTGGIIDGTEDASISVLEGESATVTLDTANIPEGKGFVGWKIGETTVSTNLTYRVENIYENTEIVAAFADQVHIFDTPAMDQNQMLRKRMSGGNVNDYCLELDRVGSKSDTVFVPNSEKLKFYIYTTPYANKADYVGVMIMENSSDYGWRFVTESGEHLWCVEGNPGNMWLDTVGKYRGGDEDEKFHLGKGHRGNAMDIIKAAVGEAYDENTPYYFAAQLCGRDYSIYAPSEISVIGPQAFIQNDVAQYTVSVEGGVIKDTALSEVTVFAGQQVTVYSSSDTFAGWIVDEDDENVITDNPYTFTVNANTTLSAIFEGETEITVSGGTIMSSGEASGKFNSGDSVTVKANAAETGKIFAYWYTLDGETEKRVSTAEEYTFTVAASVTVYAKYANMYTLTVIGGTVDGLDKADNGQYTVNDITAYTVRLDTSATPAGKGFTGWKIDGVSGASTASVITIAAGELNANKTIEAEYTDLIDEFTAPKMDDNESFRPRWSGGNKKDYVLEFARGGALIVGNIDHIKFYIYTSPYADKTDYVGILKIYKVGGKLHLVPYNGGKDWELEGSDGGAWIETAGGFSAPSSTRQLFEQAIGDSFDENMPYYIAAQACGPDGGIYAPSEISVIGPRYFLFGNAAQYNVSVRGGSIKNTTATSVTMFAGQPITVVCSAPTFKNWLVNGVAVEGGATYTFTVTGETTIVAVLEGSVTVTVTGGSVDGGVSATVNSGESVTVIADAPATGKAFDYWYTLKDGAEVRLSESATYSFNADADIEVIAKYADTHTLTIVGGVLDGVDKAANGQYTVIETRSYTVKLDTSAVPAGKGFTAWKIGETTYNVTDYTFTAGSITADTTIEAVYADLIPLAKPVNGNNEFFSYNSSYTMEFDRKNKGVQSEFDDPNVDHLKIYFFTSPYAEPIEQNAAGSILLLRKGDGFCFAKLDGSELWDLKGRKSDLYQDETKGYPSKKDCMFALVKAGVADYNDNTPYYVGVQACGKAGSIYAASGISLGTQALIYNTDLARHTVTVAGGTVKGTSRTSVTMYDGQSITVVPDNEEGFDGWLVNGTQKVEDAEYTFTLGGDVSLIALDKNATYTVTVENGEIVGGNNQFTSGQSCTVNATVPAGKTFVYWYTVDGGSEVVLSTDVQYTFLVTSNITVTAKLSDSYTLTLNGGVVEGETGADGVYTLLVDKSYVIKLDYDAIPAGKGFTSWSKDGGTLSEAFEYTLAAGAYTGSVEISAVYADQVKLNVTLSMASGTEMIRRNDAYTIDIDRCPGGTAFKENVDHVKLYIYTSSTADKADYVGILVIDWKLNGRPRFATVGGETIWALEGDPGNTWLDTSQSYHLNKKGNFRNILKQCIEGAGNTYDADQNYYFAAQACGLRGSTVGDGDICDIGTQNF